MRWVTKIFVFSILVVSLSMTGPVLGSCGPKNALNFDGVDDYFEVADDDSLDIGGDLTISAWINMDDQNSWDGLIVSKSADFNGFNSYRMMLESTDANRVSFGVSTDGNSFTGSQIISSSPLANDTWYHLVGVFDASDSMRIYIDGFEDANIVCSTPSVWVSSASLLIGGQSDYTKFAGGSIDEIAIFSRALSAAEIELLYHDRLTSDPNLVCYFNLNEGKGQIAQDSSGNANNGYLGGDPGGVDGNDPAWVESEVPFPTTFYVSDANGSDSYTGFRPEIAFATIQKGIDDARDCDTVLVYPDVYSEIIDFKGRNITVGSIAGAAIVEATDDYAFSFSTAEGPNTLLRNFIIRNSYLGIFVAGGASPRIRNVTVVNNGYGAAAYAGTNPDIRNCIFWNNTDGDLFECSVRYSCLEDGDAGEGNISIDPCFVDAGNGDFHLKSQGWSWSETLVLGSHWDYNSVTSRCIDAGNPGSLLNDELDTIPGDPNHQRGVNIRVNMGAFGGSSQASMPPHGWSLVADINNDGIVDWLDMSGYADGWLGSEPEHPCDANRDGNADFQDFAFLSNDWWLETVW